MMKQHKRVFLDFAYAAVILVTAFALNLALLQWFRIPSVTPMIFVLGVFLIAGGPRLLRRRDSPAARQRVRQGLRYGLLTGVWIASYTVVDGYAVRWLALSPILLDYMGNWVRIGLLLPVALRDRAATAQLWRRQWRGALVVALCSPVAYVLVLFAMQQAPLSLVAPAREVSMLFAALIGGQLLGEGDRGVRVAGALCIAAGVAALGLG